MADHLAMSDEDFLKQPLPETVGASSEAPQETPNEQTPAQEDPAANQETPTENEPAGEKPDAGAETPAAEGAEGTPGSEAPKPEGEPAPEAEPKPAAPGSEPAPKGEAEVPNYEEFYNQIMKPFNANGKEIKLQNPAEAIQLMQMGANYTRKMQEIAPHRKLLTMLDKNQMLSEDKLSFLIDLDKGDKEAIKKFIKDKGIDPLDIDVTTEPAYREGSHKVSDAEQAFATVLDELGSTPEGKETLSEVDRTWDQSSKDMLWSQPEVLTIIDAQRKTGIYARIVSEIERQKTLGQMPAGKPFLEAYQIAGDALQKSGAFNDIQAQVEGSGKSDTPAAGTPAPKPDPVPVATTTPKPKADPAASKAAAAAPSRSAPGTAKPAVNVLAMSDEEFLKLDSFKV